MVKLVKEEEVKIEKKRNEKTNAYGLWVGDASGAKLRVLPCALSHSCKAFVFICKSNLL